MHTNMEIIELNFRALFQQQPPNPYKKTIKVKIIHGVYAGQKGIMDLQTIANSLGSTSAYVKLASGVEERFYLCDTVRNEPNG